MNWSRLIECGADMGSLVENAIRDPFLPWCPATRLAQSVIEGGPCGQCLDIEIDEASIRLIALRQPKGSDRRFITTAMKITTDLERMGDLAVNIAQRSVELKSNR